MQFAIANYSNDSDNNSENNKNCSNLCRRLPNKSSPSKWNCSLFVWFLDTAQYCYFASHGLRIFGEFL